MSPHQLICSSNVWKKLCVLCMVYYLTTVYKRESTVVSSGVRNVTLVTNICSQSAECLHLFVTKLSVVHHHEPECQLSCRKMGFCLQGQGHSVGLYNQNMTVFIISLLQPNSIWSWIIINKEVYSENTGLLCSRSMFQPRLNISVNPLGPRQAAALLLWNPLQREVTVSNDLSIQL